MQNPHTLEKAVLVIVFSQDRKSILLIKRDDVRLYAFAGGAIDPQDNSAEEAAKREFEEETGYKISIERQVALYSPFGPFSRTTYLFEGKILSGSPKTSLETREVKFFALDNLPKNLVPLYHDLIQDALDPNCPKEKPMPRMYWIRDWRFVYNPFIFIPFLWGRFRWWSKTRFTLSK
jgi:8-oxo-dGTP pyrophosphatase MutT (NUDIX family)